jgi:hypothetical protein
MKQKHNEYLRFVLSAWCLVLILAWRPSIVTEILLRFPQVSLQMPEMYLKLGQGHFFPHIFQFTIFISPCHSMLQLLNAFLNEPKTTKQGRSSQTNSPLSSRRLSPALVKQIQSTSSHPIYLRFILILSIYLLQDPPCCFFPSH